MSKQISETSKRDGVTMRVFLWLYYRTFLSALGPRVSRILEYHGSGRRRVDSYGHETFNVLDILEPGFKKIEVEGSTLFFPNLERYGIESLENLDDFEMLAFDFDFFLSS